VGAFRQLLCSSSVTGPSLRFNPLQQDVQVVRVSQQVLQSHESRTDRASPCRQEIFHHVAQTLQTDAQRVPILRAFRPQRATVQPQRLFETVQRKELCFVPVQVKLVHSRGQVRDELLPPLPIELLQGVPRPLAFSRLIAVEFFLKSVRKWILGDCEALHPLPHHLDVPQFSQPPE
jgi:hypothetical protein